MLTIRSPRLLLIEIEITEFRQSIRLKLVILSKASPFSFIVFIFDLKTGLETFPCQIKINFRFCCHCSVE